MCISSRWVKVRWAINIELKIEGMRKAMLLLCLLCLFGCFGKEALFPLDYGRMEIYYAKYKHAYTKYDNAGEFVDIRKFRGALNKIRPKIARPLIKEPRLDSAFNHLLDSIGLIDWSNDTVIIVMPDFEFHSSYMIKSKKGYVAIYGDSSSDFIDQDSSYGVSDIMQKPPLFSVDEVPAYLRASDSIMNYTLLSFDFDAISHVLRNSDPFGGYYFVFRIKIREGKKIDMKMLIVRDQLHWRAGPNDFPRQDMYERMKQRRLEQNKKFEMGKIRIFLKKIKDFIKGYKRDL